MVPIRTISLCLLLIGIAGCRESQPYVEPDPCIWFGEPENPVEITTEEFEQVDVDALDETWPRPLCIRCCETTKGSEFYSILDKLCMARGHIYIRLLSGDTIHYGYPLKDGHATHPWYAPDWEPHRVTLGINQQNYTLQEQAIQLDALAQQLEPLLLLEKSSVRITINSSTPYQKIDAVLQVLHDQNIESYSICTEM